jgi:predicted dehydrogenase
MGEIKPVRFGIIGCGSAAVPVCKAMQDSAVATVTCTFDTNVNLATDMATRFGGRAVETLGEVLSDPAVDAVYIAVPHDKLAMLAKKALEAGKHALVEKPIALSLEEVDALIALADSKGLALGVFYELRHTPAYIEAKALIEKGALGKIIGVRIQTLIDKAQSYWQVGYSGRSANPWRAYKAQAGGGVVMMNSSHALDAVRYITGLEVVSVSAEVGTLASGVEVEDTAAAVLRFDNGAIGSLFAGAHLLGADGDEKFDIYGTLGQLQLPDPYATGPLKVFLKQDFGELKAGVWHTLPMGTPPIYQCAVDDFAKAVQAGMPAPTSGRDARQTLATVLGVYEAAERGVRVEI